MSFLEWNNMGKVKVTPDEICEPKSLSSIPSPKTFNLNFLTSLDEAAKPKPPLLSTLNEISRLWHRLKWENERKQFSQICIGTG